MILDKLAQSTYKRVEEVKKSRFPPEEVKAKATVNAKKEILSLKMH